MTAASKRKDHLVEFPWYHGSIWIDELVAMNHRQSDAIGMSLRRMCEEHTDHAALPLIIDACLAHFLALKEHFPIIWKETVHGR